MFSAVLDVQLYIGLALSVAALVVEVWAFVGAARARRDAFPVVGRLSKAAWLVILGLAAVITFSGLLRPIGLLSLIGAAAAIYFLVDTRPKLREVTPDRPRRDGPYTGW